MGVAAGVGGARPDACFGAEGLDEARWHAVLARYRRRAPTHTTTTTTPVSSAALDHHRMLRVIMISRD